MSSARADRSHSTAPRQRQVKVVGYDGSDNGRNVVEGAARRVGRGDRLIIVHALEPAFEDADPASRYDRDLSADAQ